MRKSDISTDLEGALSDFPGPSSERGRTKVRGHGICGKGFNFEEYPFLWDQAKPDRLTQQRGRRRGKVDRAFRSGSGKWTRRASGRVVAEDATAVAAADWEVRDEGESMIEAGVRVVGAVGGGW